MHFAEWKCTNFDWFVTVDVPNGPIGNIPALIQIMGKPLSEPMMVILQTHICVTRPQWVEGLSTIMYIPLRKNIWTRCWTMKCTHTLTTNSLYKLALPFVNQAYLGWSDIPVSRLTVSILIFALIKYTCVQTLACYMYICCLPWHGFRLQLPVSIDLSNVCALVIKFPFTSMHTFRQKSLYIYRQSAN